ncbi:MAG TPA: hypothetical protein VMD48_09635 [Solirubrobacteraceae bacterium]|nr:hypothetical protein [Solirubrobacteraceae bacterium]
MPRRLTAAATAAVSLALLAGCGGSSSSSSSSANFKPGYKSAMSQLAATSTAIGTAVEGASNQTDAELASSFKSLATRWESETAQLDKLTAPASVASTFSVLKGAAARVGSDLAEISSAASTHDGSQAKTATEHLVSDVAAGRTADRTIRAKLGLPAPS